MFVVFAEVQRFGLGWNSLAGVITKFAATFVLEYNAPTGTQKLIVVNQSSVGTVIAGALNLFSEQHGMHLLVMLRSLYTNLFRKSTLFCTFPQDKRDST